MNVISEIMVYLATTLGGLYLGALILRFLLQMVRADFYNPISQGIVKVTNPALIPVRRVIPGVFGIDLAAIALILAIQFIIGEGLHLLVFKSFANPLTVLILGLLGALKLVTYMIWVAIIVLVISSFVAPFSRHPIIVLSHQLMEPLIRPIHRIIPPMGGLDLSVLFIGIGNTVLQKVLNAAVMGIHPYQSLSVLTIGY